MEVNVLDEQGYYESLFGIGLSYGITSGRNIKSLVYEEWGKLHKVAITLCNKQGGHNKFLESMQIWLDITAPRYWWQEFDTYRVGTSKQSESTIHTGLKHKLTDADFAEELPKSYLDLLNLTIKTNNLNKFKALLPEGFLQRRIVSTNYKVLQHMFIQRKNHKLREWKIFIQSILNQIKHPEFLTMENK